MFGGASNNGGGANAFAGVDTSNDETLYEQRSKLYKYINNTWTDIGVGNAVIQRNTQHSSIYMIMREQASGRMLANFTLDPSMELKMNQNSQKCWCVGALDCSGPGQPEETQFAFKFKDDSIGLAFRDTFDILKKQSTAAPATNGAAPAPASLGAPAAPSAFGGSAGGGLFGNAQPAAAPSGGGLFGNAQPSQPSAFGGA